MGQVGLINNSYILCVTTLKISILFIKNWHQHTLGFIKRKTNCIIDVIFSWVSNMDMDDFDTSSLTVIWQDGGNAIINW